jgi:peptide/nickel transport system permease protein
MIHEGRQALGGDPPVRAGGRARTGQSPLPAQRVRPTWRQRIGSIRSRWLTMGAYGVLVVFVLFAALAGVLAPYAPDAIDPMARTEPPSATHWFGTDNLGRDILSRVIHGTRGILTTSVSAALLGVLGGTLVGLFSGYLGGWVDEVTMRLVDTLLAVPAILLALLLMATLGGSRLSVVLGIGIVYTPTVARVVRSAVRAIKGLEFVRAARLRGEGTAYILFREILPNIWSPIVVEASVRISYAILLTASFGFLGLGVQEPQADWGLMVSRARNYIQIAPWMAIFPTLAISLLVVSLSLVADDLRQRLGSLPEPSAAA